MPKYSSGRDQISILKELYGIDDYLHNGKSISKEQYQHLRKIKKSGTELEKIIWDVGEDAKLKSNR
jgi:hypothetical protein